MSAEHYLSVAEVAAELAVSEATVRLLIRGGLLKCFRIGPRGGRIRVSRAQLAAYLAGTERRPAEEPARAERIKFKHFKLGA